MSSKSKSIAMSIVKFLKEELSSETKSADSSESIEVAIQCLESAYEIGEMSPTDPSVKDLRQLFPDSSSRKPSELTDEDKALGIRMKDEGNALMKENKVQEAIEKYTSAIEADPFNAVFYSNRAAAHCRLGNHTATIADCKQAVQLDPSYSKAYSRMGVAHLSLNQLAEAKTCCQKALELEPDNESYKNNLRLVETNATPGAGASTAPPGNIDLRNFINNPSLLSMASQIIMDPSMQPVLNSIMNMNQGDSNMEALFQAGQQLAQQMHNSNPGFVENLRRQLGGEGRDPDPATDPNDPGEPKSK